jgi:hypothetical protein
VLLRKKTKERIARDVKKSLKALGLLDAYSLHMRETGSASLTLIIVPKGRSKFVSGMCESLTMKGLQCRLDPVPGERLCAVHLTLSKEGE